MGRAGRGSAGRRDRAARGRRRRARSSGGGRRSAIIGFHYAFSARDLPCPRRAAGRAGAHRPLRRRRGARRAGAVLRAAAGRALPRVSARGGLPRRPGRRAVAAAAAAGRDRPRRHRVGRLESEVRHPRLSRAHRCGRGVEPAARPAAGRAGRRLDVAAALRSAAEGARAAAAPAGDPPRPRRHAARRRHGIRPGPASATPRRSPSGCCGNRTSRCTRHCSTWNDDLRNAPQLVLDNVHFRLESRFGRHRFGLRGTPPAALAAPVDVRGDVRRGAGGDWSRATGKLYARLDYADIAAAGEWLPLPVAIARGKGALRLWLDLVDGKPTEVVADLALADVRTKLGPDLPDLDLASLSGRAGWRDAPPRHEVHTRALAFVATGGARLEPTDLKVTLREATGDNAATGLVEFDRLQLAPLVALVAHLPLPARLRSELARLRAARDADPRPLPVGRAGGRAVDLQRRGGLQRPGRRRARRAARRRGPHRAGGDDAGDGRPAAFQPQRGARPAAGLRRPDRLRQPRRRIQLDAHRGAHDDRDRAAGIRQPARRGSRRRPLPDGGQRPGRARARRPAHPRRRDAGAPLPAAGGRLRRARLAADGTHPGQLAGGEAEAGRQPRGVSVSRAGRAGSSR